IVSARLPPIDQKRLGHCARVLIELLSKPPDALNGMFGKNAALAIPICSLAAAAIRSLLAISGLRSRRTEGMTTGIGGGGVRNGAKGTVSAEGGLPVRTAIACSSAFRATA